MVAENAGQHIGAFGALNTGSHKRELGGVCIRVPQDVSLVGCKNIKRQVRRIIRKGRDYVEQKIIENANKYKRLPKNWRFRN
jgi:hypothetical protein